MAISLIDHLVPFEYKNNNAGTTDTTSETVKEFYRPTLFTSLSNKLTNCKNCGALLHYIDSYCKCEYCDTEYWK